jgi:peptide methionine sulfoxide reductase MsrA
VIFFHDESQQQIINQWIQDKQKNYTDPIVTEIKPAEEFWLAE